MEPNLEQFKIIVKNQALYPVVAIYMIILALGSFVGYTGLKTYNLYTTLQQKNIEIETSKASVELIQKNQNILQDNIDEYTVVLQKAIPDTETYFSVISALEELAINTGVEIVQYSIDFDATTQSKLTLSVDIQGPPEALDVLYEKYRYASGRLITSDSVTINRLLEGKVVMSFNFYHSQVGKTQDMPSQQVTVKDIEFVKQVAEEIE